MEKNFYDFLQSKFQSASLEEWIDRINKDLRSGDYQALVSHHSDGIDIQPAYTAEGLQVSQQPFRNSKYWGIVEEITVANEKQANKQALNALERGATAILFYLEGSENLDLLFEGIEIQFIRLRLVVNAHPVSLAEKLKDLIASRGLKAEELDIFFNYDPLENLARTGDWFESEDQDFQVLKDLLAFKSHGINALSTNVNLFANAGATAAQQLGIALAMIYETHFKLGHATLEKYWVNFAVAGNYFTEIAKLRAFRQVYQQLAKELEAEAETPVIYAESALRNKSIRDVYNNMIRTTAEAMASVIGGADELLIRSFDYTLGKPGEFGERIARNQQHILQYESHLSEVQDIASGSYFLERLTTELAEKGWDFFKDIEEQGGFTASLQSSWLQDNIEASARKEQTEYTGEGKVMVGVNKFTREDKDLVKLLSRPMFTSVNSQEHKIQPVRMKRLAEDFESEFRNI